MPTQESKEPSEKSKPKPKPEPEQKPEPKPKLWPLVQELLPPLSSQEQSELRQDIEENGVQYPVKVLPDGRIFDGHSRWVLSRGKAPFEVVNVDEEKALELGLRLNLKRRHLSQEQKSQLIRELRNRNYTQQRVASLLGISRSSVDLVENVNQIRNDKSVNAKGPPDLRVKIPESHYRIIWERAKREAHSAIAADYKVTDGRISQIIQHRDKILARKAAVEELEKRAENLPPLQSQFSTIVVDPPWSYEGEYDPQGHRGTPPYPVMTIEAIKALPIPFANDCFLWLWTTNAHLHDAFHILEAWGFEPKSVLTWAKDSIGLGKNLRGQTEHCILAVRGKPKLKLTNQSTLIRAPGREHSRKPDEFYKLVDELCEGPKLDYFGREPRPGWHVQGTALGLDSHNGED